MIELISLAAVPLFSWADRRVGSGGPNVIGPFGGRSVGFLTAGVVGAGLGYLALGPAGAVMGPFWSVYRSLDFKHGALIPVNNKERLNSTLRHLLSMLVAVPMFFLGGPWLAAAFVMAVYAVAATSLAWWLGRKLIGCREQGTPWNDSWHVKSERLRGAAYGAAFAVICLL
jgi:hypothetical protein